MPEATLEIPSGPRMRTVAVGRPMDPHTTCGCMFGGGESLVEKWCEGGWVTGWVEVQDGEGNGRELSDQPSTCKLQLQPQVTEHTAN